MKRFVAFIVLSFFFSSCTTFIFTGRDNAWYAVKKIDGKKQWGAVSERYVRGLPYNELDADGNEIRKVKGYIHLSSTDRELKRELGYWPFDAIGIKYDSIRLVNFHDYEMFFAYKDGKRYYYTGGFRPIADEQPVERVEYISSGVSKCFKNQIEAKFHLADGSVYTTNKGPVEDIEVGFWGYALKDNGKWGYFYGRSDIKNKDKRFTQTVPFAYDEIIEALDMKYMNHLVFARQGNVWHTYNKIGERIPTDMNMINKVLNEREQSRYNRPNFLICSI